MMNADWSDLRVFLTLSRAGNLTAAARQLDVSHPTVSRRVKALEGAIGARLFDRLADRFVLTPAGEELLVDAQAMERAAESIHRRSAGLSDAARGTVRLSAGEAMTTLIARHLPVLQRQLPHIEFELSASHMLANLSRREADLLIREQVPDLASLVTRRIGRAAFAVYRARALEIDCELRAAPWIGFDEDHAYMPGQAWIAGLLGPARPAMRANNWLVVHEAVRAGVGLSVLPCHLGDADPALVRVGRPIDEVATDQWLLVHRDLRDLPRVRAVMDALVALFQDERELIEGLKPQAAAIRR